MIWPTIFKWKETLYYLQCYCVVYRLEILVELEMSTRNKHGIRSFKTNRDSASTCSISGTIKFNPAQTGRHNIIIGNKNSFKNCWKPKNLTDFYIFANRRQLNCTVWICFECIITAKNSHKILTFERTDGNMCWIDDMCWIVSYQKCIFE